VIHEFISSPINTKAMIVICFIIYSLKIEKYIHITVMAMGSSGFHSEMVCPKDRASN